MATDLRPVSHSDDRPGQPVVREHAGSNNVRAPDARRSDRRCGTSGLRSVAIRPGLSIASDSQTCHLPVSAVEGNWSGSCFALMACGTLYLVMQGGVHCRVELAGMDHVATTGG